MTIPSVDFTHRHNEIHGTFTFEPHAIAMQHPLIGSIRRPSMIEVEQDGRSTILVRSRDTVGQTAQHIAGESPLAVV